jgi:hypothetical protein
MQDETERTAVPGQTRLRPGIGEHRDILPVPGGPAPVVVDRRGRVSLLDHPDSWYQGWPGPELDGDDTERFATGWQLATHESNEGGAAPAIWLGSGTGVLEASAIGLGSAYCDHSPPPVQAGRP